ncbi:NblA/ycf18 family protein [Leptothoe spongobia]|uniref:NblA/ycf18 family protein n=1 Tax=Leptothoe spongobia TAU-MAC 1115 TaxID=1967444 RepID=A0A947GPL5_9CYAN|nr:NblA/ycf18 family protein [Leptothoe spongobia]MBT9316616.1 NblA/ycf18 family protein [Leptothoe spongobia TAU-MAC 1115]
MEQVKDLPGDLTLEQQFQLRMITLQVRELGLKQAQEYVVEITRQMMIKDNLVKHLLKSA